MSNNNQIDRFYLIELFDVYKELLTKKQSMYFEEYHLNDQSLSEISSIHSVSRNAILDSINKTESILLDYENKLNLLSQKKQIIKWLENDDNKIKEKILKLKLFK